MSVKKPKAKPKIKMTKKPIREDFELSSSSEETKTIALTEEQRLMSKNIVINCPLCNGRIQVRNEIKIIPKAISCKCNPCSFKISKNNKTMAVSRDEQGDIKLDCQDHSISFIFNRRQITPESEDEKQKYEMIQGTPPSKSFLKVEDLD